MAKTLKLPCDDYQVAVCMTEKEARVLSLVLASIGGSRIGSQREYTDNIYFSLAEVGISYLKDNDLDPDKVLETIETRGLYFKDYGKQI